MKQKHKVLVVEDEQDTADLLKHVLEREGFSVLQAKDGRQASTMIGTVRPPSLVLLDLVVPYVSGSELLKLIRDHPDWARTPVIVVSADSYEPDIQQALRQGATAYVTKQKGSAGLIEAMRRVLHPPASSRTQPIVKKLPTVTRKQRPSARRRPRSNHGNKRAA
ncbi:MAG: two-component system response regulator [Nitrospira sp. WS110]|nr:two-component system response regulator [Nitrospira sp. WS110]